MTLAEVVHALNQDEVPRSRKHPAVDQPWWVGLGRHTRRVLRRGVGGGVLSFLGKGSSRVVFEVTGGTTVLKVARNRVGVAQNLEEIRLSRILGKEVVAGVVDCDTQGRWLEMERVVPDPALYDRVMNTRSLEFPSLGSIALAVTGSEERAGLVTSGVVTETQHNLLVDLTKTGLDLRSDTWTSLHWGRGGEGGPLVLLDYGGTETVFRNYYRDR